MLVSESELSVGEQQTSDSNYLTHGPLFSAVWRLSWPILANMAVIAVGSFVEGIVAGRLGKNVQAGAGLSGQIWYFNIMLTLALAAGTTAIVSKHWGARDFHSTIQSCRLALLFSVVFGVASCIFSLVCGPIVLHCFKASMSVEHEAWEYLKYTAISMIPSSVLWITNSVFRATGDARTPMGTMAVVTALMVIGEWFLCLHTPLKVVGIGVSMTISCSVGVFLNFFALKRSFLHECIQPVIALRELSSCKAIKQFLAIGLPACVQDISLIGGSFGIFFILSHSPDSLTAQAAWAAGWKVEEVLTIMPMYALNMAAAAVVGQNLGAKNFHRATMAGWYITALGAGISTLVSVLLLLQSDQIARFMCPNIDAAHACGNYMRTVSISQPLFACWLVLSGAMQGAGYTLKPMFVTIFSFNIIRLTVAWIAVHSAWSIDGVWLAMAISSVLGALLLAAEWQSGNWKK